MTAWSWTPNAKDYFEGAPSNAGVVLRVIPDDTMRGLELRTGAINLVVNDIDARHRARPCAPENRCTSSPQPGLDYAYVGINLRDPAARRRARGADARWGFAVDTAARSSSTCDEDSRFRQRRASSRRCPGRTPADLSGPDAVQSGRRGPPCSMRPAIPDPDGPPAPATRMRLTLKTSTAGSLRLQAAVIQQDLGRGSASPSTYAPTEFAHALRRRTSRGRFQLFTLQWVGVTPIRTCCGACSTRRANATGRLQPRVLQQRGGRSADRRGRRPRPTTVSGAGSYTRGAADHRRRTCRTSAFGTRRTSRSSSPACTASRSPRSPISRSSKMCTATRPVGRGSRPPKPMSLLLNRMFV